MQWMVPTYRLGEMQNHILDRCLRDGENSHWIQGFAGSGKSVLLVHAINQALNKNPKLTVCAVVYTHALKDLIKTGIPDHLGEIPVMTYHSFRRNPQYYDLIVVDEVQDLEKGVLDLLVKNSGEVIVAGDEEQSIYDKRISSAEIDQLLSPTIYRTEVIYRLTEAVRKIVSTILPNSKIHSARIHRGATVQVTLAKAADLDEETEWVWHESKKCAKQGDPVAILLPSHKLIRKFIRSIFDLENAPQPKWNKNGEQEYYEMMNEHLFHNDINLQYLGSGFGSLAESDQRPLVYVMTYHSAKGLDFETVFLPFLDEGLEFWSRDKELGRRLFFVATTRSRNNLYMSYHKNQPHEYVRNMPQHEFNKIACTIKEQLIAEEDVILF